MVLRTTWRHREIDIEIEEISNDRRRITAIPKKPDVFIAKKVCETTYPLDLVQLIYEAKGPAYLCDEISREEIGSRSSFPIQKVISAYVPEASLNGKRILDFGCGAGASTMQLARLFPESDIVGVDIEDQFLQIARQRASHYSYENVAFVVSPNGAVIAELEGLFDFVVLAAVYEHLLPQERKEIFPQLYSYLKPGGIIFLMETPNRYWPIETHTTNLPFLNFLPDKLAYNYARRLCCHKICQEETWGTLLRRGIRGGSVRELMDILRSKCDITPHLLKPCRKGFADRIDLCWPGSERCLLKQLAIRALKILKLVSGIEYVSDLELAIQKGTSQSGA